MFLSCQMRSENPLLAAPVNYGRDVNYEFFQFSPVFFLLSLITRSIISNSSSPYFIKYGSNNNLAFVRTQ